MIITKRELDEIDKGILKNCADGKPAKEIAHLLNISQKSVEAKIAIMKKYYNCKSLPQLISKLKDLSVIN